MVDYKAALLRPFTNPRKLAVAVMLQFIPFLIFVGLVFMLDPQFLRQQILGNSPYQPGELSPKLLLIVLISIIFSIASVWAGLVFQGYVVACGKSALYGSLRLPEWKGWGGLLKKGFFSAIIALVYFSPIIAFFVWVSFSAQYKLMSYAAGADSLSLVKAALDMGPSVFVLFPLFILLLLVIPVAVLSYASTDKLSSAFNIGAVFSRTFRFKYLLNSLGLLVFAFFASWIIGLPLVGLSIIESIHGIGFLLSEIFSTLVYEFLNVVLAIIFISVLGQVYAEMDGNRPVPIKNEISHRRPVARKVKKS